VFANVVAPRLGPVREREPVAPLKFAQLVGLVFAVVGVAGFAAGASLVGVIATAAALVAAFLNAAFGICLGCQLYPLVVRLKPAHSTSS
jgi:Ca2+/Na+ antiporter